MHTKLKQTSYIYVGNLPLDFVVSTALKVKVTTSLTGRGKQFNLQDLP
jgi:hypothetical protein